MKKIAFFDSKKYDIASFNKINKKYKIVYFEDKLTIDTVILAKGFDAVCVFVNDDISKNVIFCLALIHGCYHGVVWHIYDKCQLVYHDQ